MSRLELHVGPHGLDVGGGEDDEGPPAGLHTVEDLVRDGASWQPVPGVHHTSQLLVSLVRTLQAGQEDVLHVLTVLLGEGDEDVEVLRVVHEVLRKQIPAPGVREHEDHDEVAVDVSEDHQDDGHYQHTDADNDQFRLEGWTEVLSLQEDDLVLGLVAVNSEVAEVQYPTSVLLHKLQQPDIDTAAAEWIVSKPHTQVTAGHSLL